MTLYNINEAAKWATDYIANTFENDKKITSSNISYLIQYGRIKRITNDGNIKVSEKELKDYYDEHYNNQIEQLNSSLGEDANLNLAFDNLTEKERTKHVHKLHPYKGKFIPQLVNYFLNDSTDDFKKKVFFNKGDTVLDPFLGSGTTLIESKELGINSIGIDISMFNCMISKAKIADYNIEKLEEVYEEILNALDEYDRNTGILDFDKELRKEMTQYNKENFTSPDYKIKVRTNEINEEEYSREKEKEFISMFYLLADKYNQPVSWDYEEDLFLEKWFHPSIKKEFKTVFNIIDNEDDENIKMILKVVLSRSIRSSRATTHSDLATLKAPQTKPYYCKKHYKICTPVNTMLPKFKNYFKDTIRRIREYDKLKTDAYAVTIHGDSREVDILEEVSKQEKDFSENIENNKIDGIFTSPPYIGHIDYHEQHAYAYELFDIERKDSEEIGKLSDGKSIKAKKNYIENISEVFAHSKKYLKDNADIFIVANDQYGIYPEIAKKAGLKIIKEYKRPVLNRTERNKKLYVESVFHMKKEG